LKENGDTGEEAPRCRVQKTCSRKKTRPQTTWKEEEKSSTKQGQKKNAARQVHTRQSIAGGNRPEILDSGELTKPEGLKKKKKTSK